METTVVDYIAEFLERHSSSPIYAISGASNVRVLDAIARRGLQYVCPHHEQAGVMAALTQTRLSGKIGVMTVTAGPGASNTFIGIADAWLDSIPVLIISGQEKSEFLKPTNRVRGKGVQGLDMVQVVKSVTKYAVRLEDPKDIRRELEKCLHFAQSGRPGPVWLELPQDLQTVKIAVEELPPFIPEPENASPASTRDFTPEITKLAGLLANAQRPMIWAGHGIRLAGEVELFRKLVPKLGIPVLLSWAAADFLDDKNPLYVGRAGTYGQRGANFALQNCDLLIALGTRLAIPQRGYEEKEFARAAKKVIIDIDPTELEKFKSSIDLPIVGDVGEFLRQLAKFEQSKPLKYHTGIIDWPKRCQEWRVKYPMCLSEYKTMPKGHVNSYYFIDQLSDHLLPSDTIITDMGTSLTCTHATIKIKLGQRLVTSTGLGEMGYGLPGAIGACYGTGKKRVVFIGAEGSLMFNLQELQTVISHKLPIKIFILNNNCYLTIKHTENAMFGQRFSGCTPESGVTFPDLQKLLTAFGFPTYRIDDSTKLNETISQVLAHEGPVFCNVIMPSDQLLIPKSAVKTRKDGSIYSPPLEDLFPYLPREELKGNMIIPLLEEEK